jgi:short subunit dehydrogenase-like uncharacterized protein
MSVKIILFGATGFTGRLVAGALLRRGWRPVLAGRSLARLRALSEELGRGFEVAEADVDSPESVSALVGRGDVLISTVGPFARFGDPAVEAALQGGARYLDSNGEPAFTRRVFEQYGPRVAEAGIALLTAFGWECVLGNVAGALALREAGERAVRVDTGYFYDGRVGFSGGTRASWASAVALPSFAFRDGRMRTVRGGERYRTMAVHGQERPAISFGGSEHFALPRSFTRLREVNTYQGWFGRSPSWAPRLLRAASGPGARALALPGMRGVYEAAIRRVVHGSTGGPSAAARVGGRVQVVAVAYDAEGSPMAEIHTEGPEGYELTGELLAWAADRIASGALQDPGALGPIEAFGIEGLKAGFSEVGVQLAIAEPRDSRGRTRAH